MTVAADGALHRDVHRRPRRLLPASISTRPAARASTARRSIRSTCSNDQPPAVSFVKPGRDTSASPIEEVFLEAKAEDDYGVKSMELVYSINGGAEKTVKLFDGATRMATVSAGTRSTWKRWA